MSSNVAQVIRGEWDVAAVASQAWDIADKVVGTVGGGRIGRGLVRRLRARPRPSMLRAPCCYMTICKGVCAMSTQEASSIVITRMFWHAP